MSSIDMSLKMAAAAMSMRLATSAWRCPKSCSPRSRPDLAVSRVAHGDAVAARVVGLVVVRFAADGDRVEPGGERLVVAQAGAGRDHVEDLDDLGPEAAGELPVATEGVLAGNPPLLVGRGPEREVGRSRAGGGG